MAVSFTCEMCEFFPERERLPHFLIYLMFRAVPRCSGLFRTVPGCSGLFRSVPGCSGVFRCSGVPGVPGFSTCRQAALPSTPSLSAARQLYLQAKRKTLIVHMIILAHFLITKCKMQSSLVVLKSEISCACRGLYLAYFSKGRNLRRAPFILDYC